MSVALKTPGAGPLAVPSSSNLMDEVLSVSAGALFTLVLFVTMANSERKGGSRQAPVMEDIREVSLPLDLPPPPVVQAEPQPEVATVTGIDVAAAESPVRIAVAVPVLEPLPVPLAPPARIQTSVVARDLKPRMDVSNDSQHVFQQREVDERPVVLVNTAPLIPSNVRKGARMLRVNLLFLVDTDGAVGKIRVLKSSGNDAFDAIIAKCVHEEWVFSPAIRKGKKVKCLVERAVIIKWEASPFDS